MPTVSAAMLERLGLKIEDMPSLKGFDAAKEISAVKAGTPFVVGETLFERVTPERIEELKQKYGSSK